MFKPNKIVFKNQVPAIEFRKSCKKFYDIDNLDLLT